MDKLETPEEFISLSAALEARDKLEEPLRGIEQYQAWQVAKKATPAALDWIAKALPYIKDAFNEAQSQIEALYLEVDGWKNSPGYVGVMNGAKKRVAELEPLIAQAEGKEVGE